MNASNWIALSGIIIAAIVALAIAHMQRKQMRQIELHRADPSVPLRPPLHPVTRFVRRYGYFLAALIYDVVMIYLERRETTPLTREDTFGLAFHMAGAVLMIVLITVLYSTEVATDAIMSAFDDLDHILRDMAGRIEKLEQRKK